jgi:fatty-acyl-CoA synthase
MPQLSVASTMYENYPTILLILIAAFLLYKVIIGYLPLLQLAYGFITVRYNIAKFLSNKWTVPDWFESVAKSRASHTALMYENRVYTYHQLNNEANKVAYWALKTHNLSNNVTVALLMENRPEFIFIWLGLAKIGCCVALINTNLKGQALKHSIEISKANFIIVGTECANAIDGIKQDLPYVTIVPVENAPADNTLATASNTLQHQIATLAINPDDLENSMFKQYRSSLDSNSLLFYIYTSGTSGLPKAAKIKHIRFFTAGISFVQFFGVRASDRIYCVLPLYHAAGGMAGLSMSWCRGATMVLRQKFSASAFFQDCTHYNVTVIQYIGQLCRYLLAAAPGQYDKAHSVRVAIGNGLQRDIWAQFVTRFSIPNIGEFYASTEGNTNLINNSNKIGAIGYIPWLASLIYPVNIVQFDQQNNEIIRDSKGRAIPCKTGEVGELIGKITANDPLRDFQGYSNNSKATQSKVLTNVFSAGDSYFRSGDLVTRDAEGFIYFVDRVGDTFRWKGENCATTECETIINNFNCTESARVNRNNELSEVNVYGVSVGNNEGKAGMASIVLLSAEKFDFTALWAYLNANMPAYQMPLFLRIQQQMEITGTFKHKKSELVEQGFNPDKVKEPLFFRDDRKKTFLPLDQKLYQAIISGEVRV